jgi:hypothetical protein
MENIHDSPDPILSPTITQDMIDFYHLAPGQQVSRSAMIEFRLRRMVMAPLDEFIRQVETINLNKRFSPQSNTTYGMILLRHVIRACDEAKVHHLLEEGVVPNIAREVAYDYLTRGKMVFGAMGDAFKNIHRTDAATASRIIIDLIRHGAIFDNDDIDVAKRYGYPQATIDEWLTYVPEGQQWLAHILALQTPEGLRNAYYQARAGPLGLLAGTEDAINANVPGSEMDYLTNPSDKYFLHHWGNRELQTYIAPPGLQTRRRGGKRHSKKQKSQRNRENTRKNNDYTKTISLYYFGKYCFTK